MLFRFFRCLSRTARCRFASASTACADATATGETRGFSGRLFTRDAASLVNSQPEKPRVSPVAVASAHAVLAEAKRQRAVRDKQRKNRKKKKKLLPVTEQL